MILDNNNIFIKPGSERYVSKLINDWIDTSNTPKKDNERVSGKTWGVGVEERKLLICLVYHELFFRVFPVLLECGYNRE